jgi:hypothetical protein
MRAVQCKPPRYHDAASASTCMSAPASLHPWRNVPAVACVINISAVSVQAMAQYQLGWTPLHGVLGRALSSDCSISIKTSQSGRLLYYQHCTLVCSAIVTHRHKLNVCACPPNVMRCCAVSLALSARASLHVYWHEVPFKHCTARCPAQRVQKQTLVL